MTRVALDTVVLAAIIDTGDKWHQSASALRDALNAKGVELVLFDVVVNEAIGVLMRRLHEQKRASQIDTVLDQLQAAAPVPQIQWLSHNTADFYVEILALVRQHKGELNFHDALMAPACRDNEIRYIASYDRDFDKKDWLTRIDSPANVPQS